MRYWIGLGSNIGDGRAQIANALRRLALEPGIKVLRRSCDYASPPWGLAGQADFVNAVAELAAELEPHALLGRLMAVESEMGRVREGRRWGPRSIDLDLLLAGGLVIETTDLVVPHPHLHERAFVMVPMAELEPGLEVPGQGILSDLLRRLPEEESARVRKL